VTLAEMMVGNARLLCLDEVREVPHMLPSGDDCMGACCSVSALILRDALVIGVCEVSTGLDAAVTTSIFSSLRSMCRITGTSVVATLLQPTPETYNLFDEVVLLHGGQVVFHGPRTEVQRWLWEVCGLDVPATVDEASFLMDFLVNATMAYESAQIDAQAQAFAKATRADREASETADRSELRKEKQQGGVAHTCMNDTGTRGAFSVSAYTPALRPDVYDYATYSQMAAARAKERADKDDQLEPSHVVMHLDEDYQTQQRADDIKSQGTSSANLVAPADNHAPSEVKPAKPERSTAPAPPVRDMVDLQARYRHTRWHQRAQARTHASIAGGSDKLVSGAGRFVPTALEPVQWSAYTRASYAQSTPHSASRHMSLCWSRQWKLFVRAVTIMVPRMAKAFLIGLCYGLLFFQVNTHRTHTDTHKPTRPGTTNSS
jgi:hypothetical protein